MRILCFYQEVKQSDPEDVVAEGFAFYDDTAGYILDTIAMTEEESDLFPGSIPSINGDEAIHMPKYTSEETDNPDYDEEGSDEEDENPRYIYQYNDLLLWPLYQNAISLLPLSDRLCYQIVRTVNLYGKRGDSNMFRISKQVREKANRYDPPVKSRFDDALMRAPLNVPEMGQQVAPTPTEALVEAVQRRYQEIAEERPAVGTAVQQALEAIDEVLDEAEDNGYDIDDMFE